MQYRLFDSIASGGMGTVHYGLVSAGLGLSRVVAVKRMHGDLARDATCLAMFQDELRLSTRVRHPNVVATLDMVEQGGELLMVMELVQGESLQDLLARASIAGERIPPAIAVAVVCGLLQGLEAVHDATDESGVPLGIVHRDVSPENILVGKDGIARLLDFGIARGAGRKHITRIGEIKGKPSYLAPEQILGEAVDRRADVYGAAVVLWEALTGKRLFDGETTTATLSRVLTDDVARPSSLVSALPAGLDDVVMRGLSRDPATRFATALEMARALRSACGSLLPFEVAEWVGVTARESLLRQAENVVRLERAALTPVPALHDEADAPPESTRSGMALTPASSRLASKPLRWPTWFSELPAEVRHLALTVAVAMVATICGSLAVLGLRSSWRTPAPPVAAPLAAVALSVVSAPLVSAAPSAAPVDVKSAPAPSGSAKSKRRAPAVAKKSLAVDDGF